MLLLVLDFSVSIAQSKAENFIYSISNKVQVNPKQLEFDLILLDLDRSVPFEIATVQAGITLKAGFSKNGIVTAEIMPGSSNLTNPSQTPVSIEYEKGSPDVLKVASKVPPGTGSGSIMSTDSRKPTRVCRIRLTNSVEWAPGTLDNLVFCYSTKPYPTKISEYLDGVNIPVKIGKKQNIKSESIPEDKSLEGITIYSVEQSIVIENASGYSGEVRIYDLSGRELKKVVLSSQVETRIPMKVSASDYVVKVITEKGIAINKVMIR